jgi:hypothetical protein
MGFLATFRGYIEYANILFKLTMKKQAPKAMEKLRNGDPITKLWRQLGTNNLLVVFL